MSLNVYRGRPTDRRTGAEERCYDLLDLLGIDYLRLDHELVLSSSDCVEIEETLEIPSCKNLFLHNARKTRYYLLLMPSEKHMDAARLAHEIGETRFSFGSAQAMKEMLGIEPGSVSLLALINDPDEKVRLLIDEEVLKSEFLGIHPCVNTTSLKISTKDVREKLLPALGHEPILVRLPRESL